jgi:hypothetical protein
MLTTLCTLSPHSLSVPLRRYSTGARLIFSCLLELARIDSVVQKARQQQRWRQREKQQREQQQGAAVAGAAGTAGTAGTAGAADDTLDQDDAILDSDILDSLPAGWRGGARGIIGDVLLLGAPVACEATGAHCAHCAHCAHFAHY